VSSFVPSFEAIEVPAELAASHARFRGDEGRAWIAGLPALASSYLERWELRLDGPLKHGMVALVLPVLRPDGTRAVLKLQHVDFEHVGEGTALRAWGGAGAVLVHAEGEEALLLERLEDRPLTTMPSADEACGVIASLLARLHAVKAPAGIRPLSEIVSGMLADVPKTLAGMALEPERDALRYWASALEEVSADPGDRLLHWDLHYDNVLAGSREPWLAIDPKPLSGDPGFDLLPALHNRWEEVVASGDVGRAVRRRFDIMTEILRLERDRAVAWTLGRLLQNSIWEIAEGPDRLDATQLAVAGSLTG
jgi:streptomycin 6-kinase